MTIGQSIRRLRREAGLTHADLAARIGVSRSTVALWERGRSQPRVGALDGIAEALGVDAGMLVCPKESEPVDAQAEEGWTVPLVSREATPSGEVLGACVEVPKSLFSNHPNAIAVVMPDDSMSRAFPEGFVVVCDPDRAPANGSSVVASVDGQTLVRRWYRGNGHNPARGGQSRALR